MIDLHAHFLPETDDGAKNAEMSIKMLEDSFSQGVKICAATPHCVIHKEGDIDRFLERRQRSFNTLMSEIESKDVKHPEILLGAEVYFDNDINAYKGIERLCIGETSHILIEFGARTNYRLCADWIHSLILKGIHPMIAHIDRYPDYENILAEFNGMDLIYQINAARFLSVFGRRKIRKLLQYNNKYLVSSDMHDTQIRKCNILPAYNKAQKKFTDFAEDLFENNAKKLLGDRYVGREA